MTTMINMASVIAGTDDMETQNTLWMYESKSAVIVRRKLDQSILTAEISFPQEKSLEPGTVVHRIWPHRQRKCAQRKTCWAPVCEAISNIYQ